MGAHVRVVARKWPDRRHWEHDALWLGADRHGTWLGAPAGTVLSRPGASFTTPQDQVVLVPPGSPFVATFYARLDRDRRHEQEAPCEVYVDITTVPEWADGTVTAFDLDLDVVRGWSGRVWVDDEDEFADHRVRYRYPADLVRLAASSAAAVREAVEQRRAPYDGVTPRQWFDALGRLSTRQ